MFLQKAIWQMHWARALPMGWMWPDFSFGFQLMSVCCHG
jgi:hypothetical protein